MANRCDNCKKFFPANATKCPRCEPDTGELFADPGYSVQLEPRFLFQLRLPGSELVKIRLEGDEAPSLVATLRLAADELEAAHNAVAP